MTGMDWHRLARAIVDRRVELGYHTREALLAGMSTRTDGKGLSRRVLADLETGRRGNYDQATLQRLEQALGWPQGEVHRIIHGTTPPPRPDEPVDISSELASPDGLAMWMRPDSHPLAYLLHHAGLDEQTRMELIKAQRRRNDRWLLESLDALAADIAEAGGAVRREAWLPWLVEEYGWKVPGGEAAPS